MCNVPVIIWCKLILRLLNDFKKRERAKQCGNTAVLWYHSGHSLPSTSRLKHPDMRYSNLQWSHLIVRILMAFYYLITSLKWKQAAPRCSERFFHVGSVDLKAFLQMTRSAGVDPLLFLITFELCWWHICGAFHLQQNMYRLAQVVAGCTVFFHRALIVFVVAVPLASDGYVHVQRGPSLHMFSTRVAPVQTYSKPNTPSIRIWREGMSAAERYKRLGEMFWWIVEYFWIVAWLQERNEAVQQHSEGFDAACLNQMSVSCWAEEAQWSICKMHQIWKTDAAHTSPVAD